MMNRNSYIVYLFAIITLVGCGPSKEETEELRFRAYSESDFRKLIEMSKIAIERIKKSGWEESSHISEFDYISPERVYFHENGFTIETYIGLDTAAGIEVMEVSPDQWEVYLFINEHDEPELIWSNKKDANQASHTMPANARLFHYGPMKNNLNRLGTSTEAAIVWI